MRGDDMKIITHLFHHYFGFTSSCCFVEYGDPSTPSWSYWVVPGTWEDE